MRTILISCFVLFWSAAGTAPDHTATFEITYIANEGFLVETGSRKILIDAIFDDETISYSHVPDAATLARMRSAQAPFDGLDLILVTHSHRDHFSSGPMLDHLRANPEAVLIAPPQAVSMLRAADPDLDRLGAQVREIPLELFDSAELEVAGIRVLAIRFRHSAYMETDPETGKLRDRHATVENLIYLIEADGVKLMHVGDATLDQNLEYLERDHHLSGPFDVAFLEYFDWSEETRELLDRWVRPERIVFMHLPTDAEKIEALDAHLSGHELCHLALRGMGSTRGGRAVSRPALTGCEGQSDLFR